MIVHVMWTVNALPCNISGRRQSPASWRAAVYVANVHRDQSDRKFNHVNREVLPISQIPHTADKKSFGFELCCQDIPVHPSMRPFDSRKTSSALGRRRLSRKVY